MTIEEAVALQPIWVQWWLIALTLATTALPIMLMFHRKTRLSGIVVLLTSFVGGYGVQILFDNLGYVRLLTVAPEWLSAIAPNEWYVRYERSDRGCYQYRPSSQLVRSRTEG